MAATQKIQGLASLQDTLSESNESLSEAAKKVSGVAEAVESTVSALNETLGAFRVVVEVLRGSDPARVLESQDRLENELKDLKRGIDQVKEALNGVKQEEVAIGKCLATLEQTPQHKPLSWGF